MVTASRAHAGLHALKQSSFDIAIVDIFIPGMGGLDAIQMIRQLLPSIPIVAMTGFRLRPSRNQAWTFFNSRYNAARHMESSSPSAPTS